MKLLLAALLLVIVTIINTPVSALTELERVTIDNASLVNGIGTQIDDNVNVNQQINIISKTTNNQDISQKFVYIIQIKNDQGIVVSLGWIGGELPPKGQLSSSMSWMPNDPGKYTVDVFIWEDLINHNALSEKYTFQINVS